MTNKATKTKSTYAVNFYKTYDDYDNEQPLTLGYVSSVSLRGAEQVARRTIQYPSGGFVVLDNLTAKANQANKELAKQAELDKRKQESGLTPEELTALENEFLDVRKDETLTKLQVKLSHFDRAIKDSHGRIHFDRLETENPVLCGLYQDFIFTVEEHRKSVANEYHSALEEFTELANKVHSAGIIDDEVHSYYAYKLTRFLNEEEERKG